jgi:beta-lactam-binding protein with PASTA domain
MMGTMSSLTGEKRMPDLVGKNLAEANARVALLGLGPITQFEIGGSRSCWDDLIRDAQVVVIEKGQICQQEPPANSLISNPKTKVAVIVQQEDPWHGHYKGDPTNPENQWHRMPKVIGMSVDDAKAAIEKAGFTIARLTAVVTTEDPACRVGLVCRQYPAPLHTHRETAKRSLIVGADPAAAAPAPGSGEGEKKPKPFID